MISARFSEEHTAAAEAGHWDDLYATRGPDGLSWTQVNAGVSAELIDSLPVEAGERVVDVGGGAGVLVDHLLAAGRRRVTVLDTSQQALSIARRRVERAGHRPGAVEWVVADVRAWRPSGTFRVWHDRAVFHFLTDPADRASYAELAAAAIDPGGHLVIGTFAADGPDRCSGLPVIGYGPDELAAQFRPAFHAVTWRDEHHRTPWGAEQHFTWLVLQRHRPEPHPAPVPG